MHAPRLTRAIAVVSLLAAPAAAQQWLFLDGPVQASRSAAYDTNRDRLVLFGADGETWEYDRNVLLHRAVPGPTPPPRTRAALVYDQERRHVLMFGGLAEGPVFADLADTWTYDGVRWTPRPATPAPSARRDAAATFDPARGRVMLVGGLGIGTNDLWEHDGVQWLSRGPTGFSALRPAMTYDLNVGAAVLVIQPGGGSTPFSTYVRSGNLWGLGGPVVFPPAREDGSLVYDPVRRCCVFAGAAPIPGQIWEWNRGVWTQRTTQLPRLRQGHASYFDPVLGKVVFVGGAVVLPGALPESGSWHTDAWSWDGTTLAQVRAGSRPPSRNGPAAFGHPTGVVLFGGDLRTALTDQTWIWSGTGWSLANPTNRPPARRFASAATDWIGGRGLLFGGQGNSGRLGDLWAWTGSDWTQLAPGGGPGTSAAMAVDPWRQAVVVFGGLGDTWEWNGTAWTQRQPATSPPPRAYTAMTFDLATGRVVLFGGFSPTAGTALADTWEWDGTSWSSVTTAPQFTPPPMDAASLATDPTTLRPALVGNERGTVSVFDYGAAGWTLRGTTALGSRLWGWNGAVMDFARNRIVMPTLEGIAELPLAPAAVVEYGSGCGATEPVLAPRTRARLGEASFGFEVVCDPGQPVLFGASFQQASVPLGNGCTLLLGPLAATHFALANANGIAVQPIPIPASQQLAGIVLSAQAAVLSAASPGGFALTRGIRITTGD